MTAFERTQVLTLARKELRDVGTVMIVSLVVAISGSVLGAFFDWSRVEGGDWVMWTLVAYVLPLFPILLGSLAYGAEVTEDASDYLATRPLPLKTAHLTKLLIGALACGLISLLTAILPMPKVPLSIVIPWVGASHSVGGLGFLWLMSLYLAAQAGQLAVKPVLPSMAVSILVGIIAAVALGPSAVFIQLLAVVLLSGLTFILARWRLHSSG